MMGAGIAYVSAKAGIEVVLVDQSQETADKGKAYSAGLLDKAISTETRRPQRPKRRKSWAEDHPRPPTMPRWQAADLLIVEAVFEDPSASKPTSPNWPKRGLGGSEDAIFATNTSTLPHLRPGQSLNAATQSNSSASTSSHRSTRCSWSRSSKAPRNRRPRHRQSARLRAPDPQNPLSSSTTPASSTPTAASSPTFNEGDAHGGRRYPNPR